MEGYSVTEAASVLGVTTERIWELLARGVLAGAPDADTGMRVFLQPRPAPTPSAMDRAAGAGPGGNGGASRAEPERELSPFRELLTEFRNLTERYGQALLALGEARGEVAALRSRVDLLEARMDLRLPFSPPASGSSGWPMSPQPAAAAAPPPGAASGAASEDVGDDDEAERRGRRRRSSHRRATESFAEALARAEDPTAPELPGVGVAPTHEPAEVVAGGVAPGPAVEASLPRELPAADEIDRPDEADVGPAAPVVPAEVPEPPVEEPMEDASVSVEPPPVEPSAVEPPPVELPRVEAEAQSQEAAVAQPSSGEAEAPSSLEPQPAEAGDAPGPEPALEPTPEPGTEPMADLEAEADVTTTPASPVGVEAEVEAPAEGEPAPDRPPIEWDPERYTVEIGEPDWYADDEPAARGASEPLPAPAAVVEDPSGSQAQAAATSSPGEPEAARASQPPPAAPRYRDEETMLWFGRPPQEAERGQERPNAPDAGAEEMEVIGRGHGPEQEHPDLPGGRELHDALAALEALSRPMPPPAPGPEVEPTWPNERAASSEMVGEPSTRPADRGESSAGAPTPATRAYRRLRRIFPG